MCIGRERRHTSSGESRTPVNQLGSLTLMWTGRLELSRYSATERVKAALNIESKAWAGGISRGQHFDQVAL